LGDEEKSDKHAADWRPRHLAKLGKGVSPCSPSLLKQELIFRVALKDLISWL